MGVYPAELRLPMTHVLSQARATEVACRNKERCEVTACASTAAHAIWAGLAASWQPSPDGSGAKEYQSDRQQHVREQEGSRQLAAWLSVGVLQREAGTERTRLRRAARSLEKPFAGALPQQESRSAPLLKNWQ